jgi:hypothetical protein
MLAAYAQCLVFPSSTNLTRSVHRMSSIRSVGYTFKIVTVMEMLHEHSKGFPQDSDEHVRLGTR